MFAMRQQSNRILTNFVRYFEKIMTTTVRQLLLAIVLTAITAIGLTAAERQFCIVIDAGHGGHDHGAVGEIVNEKSINLAVGQRLGKLIEKRMPDAKVIFTRNNDNFVTLQGRCDIANRSKGDIFVSIHTNSVDAKNPNRTKVCGASVYTLGLNRASTNLDVAMRENSVMKLEDDYSTTYCDFDPTSAESYIMFEMAQNAHIDQSIRLADEIQRELITTAGRRDKGVRQAPFWVLVRTSMPAVLVELDFICNPESERFLASDKGRDDLAQAIYNGIATYRRGLKAPAKAVKPAKSDRTNDSSAADSVEKAPGKTTENKIVYKVQILTSDKPLAKNDSRLSGLTDVDSYRHGGAVKYTVGSFTTPADAQKCLEKLKRRFPDAFVIKTKNGKRIN